MTEKRDPLIGHVDRLESDFLRYQSATEASLERLERVVDTIRTQVFAKEERKKAGQPDWLTVNDASKAERMLVETLSWLEQYGYRIRVEVAPCWPWHPEAVVLLLGAARQYRAVYRGDSEAAVMDYHRLVVPWLRRELKTVMGECERLNHYSPDHAVYTAHLDEVPELAAWWVGNREGLAPGLYAATKTRSAA